MPVLSTSCEGQQAGPKSPQPAPADSSQIGEYVVELFEDRQGNLWFGTMSEGAARFDGKTLDYFSTETGLCGNTVASIAADRAGNLWFGTHSGASRFNGTWFTTFGSAEGLHGAGCNFLVDRHGEVWAGTNDGVFRFDGAGFSEFKLPLPPVENPSYKWVAGKVWSLMEDSKGNLWFGRDGYGACRYDGSSFTHFTKEDGLCSNNVSSILEDNRGNIWFASLSSDWPAYAGEGGLSRFDGHTFTRFPDWEGLDGNDIYTLYEDKKGNVWIGATGVGAYRFDGTGFTRFSKTDREDLTANFGIQSILEDRNGTLWFGFSGGLFRFDGASFVNVTQGDLRE